MAENDQHIADLLMDKNPKAIRLIHDRYAGPLFGMTMEMIGQKEEAEEVLQEAFVKIWKNGHKYNPQKAKLFTWLFQITRNTAIDFLRKHKKNQFVEIQGRDLYVLPSNEGVDKDTKQMLRSQVNELDPKYQELVKSIYFSGMTHIEAAEHWNLPLGTVKTRLRAALKQLREVIGLIIFILFEL